MGRILEESKGDSMTVGGTFDQPIQLEKDRVGELYAREGDECFVYRIKCFDLHLVEKYLFGKCWLEKNRIRSITRWRVRGWGVFREEVTQEQNIWAFGTAKDELFGVATLVCNGSPSKNTWNILQAKGANQGVFLEDELQKQLFEPVQKWLLNHFGRIFQR